VGQWREIRGVAARRVGACVEAGSLAGLLGASCMGEMAWQQGPSARVC
jgi:hypothetical protein